MSGFSLPGCPVQFVLLSEEKGEELPFYELLRPVEVLEGKINRAISRPFAIAIRAARLW